MWIPCQTVQETIKQFLARLCTFFCKSINARPSMIHYIHRRPFIMAKREKKPVHHVQMTEGKRSIIQQLFQEYDIESAQDIQDALKDLLGGTIKEMMESEMDEHLGYEKSERADRTEVDDYRNGTKRKTVNSSFGSMSIDVPQDRNSTFEPKVVKKRQKDISDIDQKIISMYAKGMTTRQISETLMDIYGFEASEGFISDVTDKLLPQIEEWQNRPLAEIYPVLFIDAIHYSVKDNGVVQKKAAYVMLGINLNGRKEVLTIEVGQNESAKYWLAVLNGLKNRGVRDILIICADGLTGIREAIQTAFPQTEYQRCIVHQVRNTLKYVADKDRKPFAADLKRIYQAPDDCPRRRNPRQVPKKVGREVSQGYEVLVYVLGRHHTHLQVLCRRPDRNLYHQCHRESELHLSPAQPSAQRLSQ